MTGKLCISLELTFIQNKKPLYLQVTPTLVHSEAAAHNHSVKKFFRKILQIGKKNTCNDVLLLVKL